MLLQQHRRGGQAGGEQLVVRGVAQVSPAREERFHLGAGDGFVGDLLEDLFGLLAGARHAQRDEAHTDPGDAFGVEPVQPVRPALRDLFRRLAGVGQPQRHIADRVGQFPLHHPGVQPRAGQPVLHPGPPVIFPDNPIGHDLGGAARVQVTADVLDDGAAQPIAGDARIAVDVVLGARADHEGRVGHDEVEALPRHGVEEAAGPQIPGHPVEPRSGLRQRQRPRVGVGGHDVGAVTVQVQRLDTAAGAQVERALHRGPNHGPRQRHRRTPDAEDMLMLHGSCAQGGILVGDDVEVAFPV